MRQVCDGSATTSRLRGDDVTLVELQALLAYPAVRSPLRPRNRDADQEACLCDPPPSGPLPVSFTPAPDIAERWR